MLLKRNIVLAPDEVLVHCINLLPQKNERQTLSFSRLQEKAQAAIYTSEIKSYLYEPNVSVLKGGAYCMLCHQLPVEKLHPNSHLYTSHQYLSDFPGRKFCVIGYCNFNKKEVKKLLGGIEKANLTVRNFP
ncbi:hypothetical protein EVA_21068, partial [gut metagenome]